MTAPPWSRVERLGHEHDIMAFRCGRAEIDDWLQSKARANAHLISTYVCLDATATVRAFFAVKYVVVSVEGYSSAMRRGSDRNGQSVAILLAFMGLEESLQGSGFGRAVLREALTVIEQVHQKIPVQLLVVDVLDEQLVGFYAKAGFKRVSPSERRLLMPMSAVVRFLESARTKMK